MAIDFGGECMKHATNRTGAWCSEYTPTIISGWHQTVFGIIFLLLVGVVIVGILYFIIVFLSDYEIRRKP